MIMIVKTPGSQMGRMMTVEMTEGLSVSNLRN